MFFQHLLLQHAFSHKLSFCSADFGSIVVVWVGNGSFSSSPTAPIPTMYPIDRCGTLLPRKITAAALLKRRFHFGGRGVGKEKTQLGRREGIGRGREERKLASPLSLSLKTPFESRKSVEPEMTHLRGG